MKRLIVLSFLMLSIYFIACKPHTNKKEATDSYANNDIEVYYFHNTVRCVTCRTVEAETRKNIELLYPEMVKEGRITFTALNLDEETGKSTGERLGINSQTLIIVKGDEKINITNEGFLYAVSKPQKFTDIIKSKIDLLLIK
jgi:hypothetical protein